MTPFTELYSRLVKATLNDQMPAEVLNADLDNIDTHQLDCLLNPKDYAPIINTSGCDCCSDAQRDECVAKCLFEALYRDENGNVAVDKNRCVGCRGCVENCHAQRLLENKDVLPMLMAIKEAKAPVYAMIAPAFVNQFSSDVPPGKLRSAFKALGFTGMVEVALFADILTLKEALEFDKNILKESDFQLTSCCCPMWIAMIKRIYNQLIPYVPGAVSPMVACGRTIKTLYPGAVTVFIGPCVAKKAEAREKDIADSTDFVLTFHEIRDVFDAAGIDPARMEDDRDHSSRAGRIYASTGGVSEAVQSTVKRLNPDRKIQVKSIQADGVPACKAMLKDVLEGNIKANFIEGMGCVGGCVGGPKILIPKEEGRKNVFRYGNEAEHQTPIDNPYVLELLNRLGFDTVESLLEHSDIFTRRF